MSANENVISEGANQIVMDDSNPAPIPTAPATVPDKFQNADGSLNQEALLKSYSELEKMKGAPAPAEAPAVPTEGTPEDLKVPKVAEVKKAIGDKLFTEVVEHYQANGEISEELYGKLDDQGFSKDFTNYFIEGQKKISSDRRSAVTDTVGGNDSYVQMQEWAVENLTDDVKLAINKAVDSKDINEAKMGAKYLQDLYVQANGNAPSLVSGSATSSTDGFESAEAFAHAIDDPRWQKDPVFTKNIMDRLKVSDY
jgi:hypothetical protein